MRSPAYVSSLAPQTAKNRPNMAPRDPRRKCPAHVPGRDGALPAGGCGPRAAPRLGTSQRTRRAQRGRWGAPGSRARTSAVPAGLAGGGPLGVAATPKSRTKILYGICVGGVGGLFVGLSRYRAARWTRSAWARSVNPRAAPRAPKAARGGQNPPAGRRPSGGCQRRPGRRRPATAPGPGSGPFRANFASFPSLFVPACRICTQLRATTAQARPHSIFRPRGRDFR